MTSPGREGGHRRFLMLALLVALLVAGVGSYYASAHPDGLVYVAQQVGFGDRAAGSATADSPLSGYQVRGVDDERISGGLAGVLGSLMVLGVAGGLFWVLRRRGRGERRDAGDGVREEA